MVTQTKELDSQDAQGKDKRQRYTEEIFQLDMMKKLFPVRVV